MDALSRFSYLWQQSVVPSTIILLIASFIHYNRKFNYWKRINVDGPKPIPLFGNILSFLFGNRPKTECDFVRKYGKVYGFYQGSTPILAVADPDVLRQICIKDFDIFPNHQLFNYLNVYQRLFLFFAKNDHWKRTRALMSPTFTSGKLKRMFKFLDGCANDLLDGLRTTMAETNGLINAQEAYNSYTMDAIATCCYGIKLGNERSAVDGTVSKRDDFVRNSTDMFHFNPLRILASTFLPEAILRRIDFSDLAKSAFDPMARRVAPLIQSRRNSAKKFQDYLQLLIDAAVSDQMELTVLDAEESHHAELDVENVVSERDKLVAEVIAANGKTKMSLTDEEILSNAMLIMVVGLETTGKLLTHCTYALAFHPEAQEKLYQELMKLTEFDEDKKHHTFDYETLTSCRYLDSVVSESLRSMPPALISDRISESDYVIEKYNLRLPRGSRIQMAIHAVQNDPDYWNEPDKFNPDRFMPGNREKIVPGSYCPFGLGPRHCIGMRFSLTEAKLALAKIVVNFRIEPAPGAHYPPQPTKLSNGLSNFERPIVKLVARV